MFSLQRRGERGRPVPPPTLSCPPLLPNDPRPFSWSNATIFRSSASIECGRPTGPRPPVPSRPEAALAAIRYRRVLELATPRKRQDYLAPATQTSSHPP